LGLDIRLPIGGLFTFLGIVLTAFGTLGDKAIYSRSLNININLEWGIALLVFGLTMMVLARRKASAAKLNP